MGMPASHTPMKAVQTEQGGDKSDTRWHKPVTVGKRVVSERRNVSERWFDSTRGHHTIDAGR